MQSKFCTSPLASWSHQHAIYFHLSAKTLCLIALYLNIGCIKCRDLGDSRLMTPRQRLNQTMDESVQLIQSRAASAILIDHGKVAFLSYLLYTVVLILNKSLYRNMHCSYANASKNQHD